MATVALVLAGGGMSGTAWELGIAAGLEEADVCLADADFIVGTSAGSTAGSSLALGRPARLTAEAFLNLVQSEFEPAAGARPPDQTPVMAMRTRQIDDPRPPEVLRAEIGAFALNAPTMSEERFVGLFGSLIGEAWPLRRFSCTAVDALDGSFRVWDNESGVPLALAVASSCALPGVSPPVTINGRRYIDGGMRSITNADLANGYERVLIVRTVPAATQGSGPLPELSPRRLNNETNALRDSGSEVWILEPDDTSARTLAMNRMDPQNSVAALEAGLRQGRLDAERLRPVWN